MNKNALFSDLSDLSQCPSLNPRDAAQTVSDKEKDLLYPLLLCKEYFQARADLKQQELLARDFTLARKPARGFLLPNHHHVSAEYLIELLLGSRLAKQGKKRLHANITRYFNFLHHFLQGIEVAALVSGSDVVIRRLRLHINTDGTVLVRGRATFAESKRSPVEVEVKLHPPGPYFGTSYLWGEPRLLYLRTTLNYEEIAEILKRYNLAPFIRLILEYSAEPLYLKIDPAMDHIHHKTCMNQTVQYPDVYM